MENQSIPRITLKSNISNGIRLAFNATPSTKISHPLNTEVRRICSPNGVVTTNLFLSGVSYKLAYNANDELTNDLLDPELKKPRAGVLKKHYTCHDFWIGLSFFCSHSKHAGLGLL